MHPALFYRPGQPLSLAELASARLDGHVVELGEGFIPADTVEEADARAAGIADLVIPRTCACGPTAAWIHGAGDRPPPVHHLRRTTATRMRVSASPRVIYHERRAEPEDLQLVGGVPVTTPLATAVELLFAAALEGGPAPWLHALLLVDPALPSALCDRLNATARRPGRRRAMLLLTELTRRVAEGGPVQEVVTR